MPQDWREKHVIFICLAWERHVGVNAYCICKAFAFWVRGELRWLTSGCRGRGSPDSLFIKLVDSNAVKHGG